MDPILLAGAVAASATLVPEMLSRGRSAPRVFRADVGLADSLTYRSLVRPDVLKCERGYLAAWRIAAPDAGMLPKQTIVNAAYQVAATLGLLGSQGVGQFYEVRSPFREYDRGVSRSDHPVLELLDELREDQFLRREPVFDSDRVFVLTWTAPSKLQDALRAAASAGSGDCRAV